MRERGANPLPALGFASRHENGGEARPIPRAPHPDSREIMGDYWVDYWLDGGAIRELLAKAERLKLSLKPPAS
jgi:hypothetical protein